MEEPGTRGQVDDVVKVKGRVLSRTLRDGCGRRRMKDRNKEVSFGRETYG